MKEKDRNGKGPASYLYRRGPDTCRPTSGAGHGQMHDHVRWR